jgi:hypothetical protein
VTARARRRRRPAGRRRRRRRARAGRVPGCRRHRCRERQARAAARAARRGVDLTHYIGSHPMAGRERGGAISARADIFVGRPGSCAATRRPRHPISHSSKGSPSTSARRPSR